MNKNQKISMVFAGILVAVFIAVIVSALPLRTVDEWLNHYSFLSDTDRENIRADLNDAGYDLTRSYNEDQIYRAVQRMANRGDTRFDWLTYSEDTRLAGNCYYANIVGTTSYSRCSETCADSTTCYPCCDSFTLIADRQICKRHCDKMPTPSPPSGGGPKTADGMVVIP